MGPFPLGCLPILRGKGRGRARPGQWSSRPGTWGSETGRRSLAAPWGEGVLFGVLVETEGPGVGAGEAGNVDGQARNVRLSNGAQISSSTFGPGSGGTVSVTATETLTLQGGNLPTGVFGHAEGSEVGA